MNKELQRILRRKGWLPLADNQKSLPIPSDRVTNNISATKTDDSKICWIDNELADIPEEFIVIFRSVR